MSEQTLADAPTTLKGPPLPADRGVAALGTAAGFSALFAASACCILPLGLAALGVGAGVSSTVKALVPFHWPLTIVALLAVAGGWVLYLRRRKACSMDGSCATSPPARQTLVLLVFATLFVTISAMWGYIEAPLMSVLA